MTGDEKNKWDRLASDIVDGHTTADEISDERIELVDKLKQIASIANAFKTQNQGHQVGVQTEPKSILFTWGHLQVKEKVGEGSYGEVFRAYDAVLDRDVALKLLKHDKLAPYQSRAFLQEARHLGKVRNRHVLAVHGASVNDGRAGLWSDLIEGHTIKTKQFTHTDDLLHLLKSISHALVAIHEIGLIHGDIKPNNVMQDAKGRIILMDFGAGLQSQPEQKSSGFLKGTPLFMAPELFNDQPLSAASDVYALGTMMLVLMADRYPIDASNLADIKYAHKNHQQHLLKPSEHGHPKALNSLVNQMIDTNPNKRPTAVEISEQIDWISNAPQRRQKNMALAVIFSLLILGITFTSLGFYRADKAQKLIATEKQKTDAVNEFLGNMLNLTSALGRGRDAKVVDMLAIAENQVNEQYTDHPLAKAAILDALGSSYNSLEMSEKSLEQLNESHLIKSQLLNENHPELLETQLMLALSHHKLRDFDQSTQLNRQVIERAGSHRKINELANIRLAGNHNEMGQYDDALQLLLPIIELNPDPYTATNNNHFLALMVLTNVYTKQSNYSAAEHTAKQMIAWLNDYPDALLLNINIANTWLAEILSKQGRNQEAEVISKQALAVSEKIYGKQNHGFIISLVNHSAILYELGRSEEANTIQQESLVLAKSIIGPNDIITLTIASNLANSHVSLGQFDAGEQLMRDTLIKAKQSLGENEILTFQLEYNLAELLNNLGRPDEAEELARVTNQKMAATLGETHLYTLLSNDNLAVSLSQQKQFAAAIEIHQYLLPIIQKHHTPLSPYAILAHQHYVDTLLSAAQTNIAKQELESLIKYQTETLGADHNDTRQNINVLKKLSLNTGN
ncbi:tetratricopeptide repeat protein [Marinicella sediminis]|uniref:non-specific serine/threonine protein kinase n=1 Tax=Marinicella sediminis TaxID=1792834 RepID=A0ABV7JAY1_9GAMM|nr:serine/threonine-protein kinase [Marinicella sediminis]